MSFYFMAYDKKILGYLNISYNLDRNFISKCTMICETYPVENKNKRIYFRMKFIFFATELRSIFVSY